MSRSRPRWKGRPPTTLEARAHAALHPYGDNESLWMHLEFEGDLPVILRVSYSFNFDTLDYELIVTPDTSEHADW